MINYRKTHEENRRSIVRQLQQRPFFNFRYRMGNQSYYEGGKRCDGCHGDFYADPGPILVDGLWKRIARGEDVLCNRCILARLGRPLVPRYDLKYCPWNTDCAFVLIDKHSPRWRGPWMEQRALRLHWTAVTEMVDYILDEDLTQPTA